MLKGSCLCGAVQYSVSDLSNDAGHCHCRMCQKFHGAAFGTYAKARYKNFEFTQGERFVKSFQSSDNVARSFCGECGTPLQFMPKGADTFALVVTTLDQNSKVKPSYQIWTNAKISWWELDPTLQSYEAEN